MQESFKIGEEENAGDVHDKMKMIGARLLVETIEKLVARTIVEKPQSAQKTENGEEPKHAPKIFTETCKISWENDCNAIYNLVRGLAPYPAAFTFLEDKKVKVFVCKKELVQPAEPIGTYVTDKKTFLKFACKDGYIYTLDIQPEGKKRMSIADFLRGYRWDK